MSSTFKHLPLLAACFLGSCMVGPDFRTPTNDLPATWEANRPPHSSDKDLRSWWNIFGDPQLNRLVSTSLNNNPDMKVALLRIREAREKLRVSQASLLPSADASAGWSLSPDRGFRSSTSQNFSLGASTSWELDLFGGNRRSIEASRASLMSTEASAGAVRTALLADVATAYFDWITACEQLRIAREQLEIQRSTLTIAEKRYKTEFAPRLDVEQATSTVSSTESHIPQLEAQVASSKNQLAVLLGTYNSRVELTLPKASVFEKTPTVPVGLPSELLRRRPDVIAAEADLHAAVANVGVAVADLYPRLPDGLPFQPRRRFRPALQGKQQRLVPGRESAPAPVPGRSPESHGTRPESRSRTSCGNLPQNAHYRRLRGGGRPDRLWQLYLPDAIPAQGKQRQQRSVPALPHPVHQRRDGLPERDHRPAFLAQLGGIPGHHEAEHPQGRGAARARPGRRVVTSRSLQRPGSPSPANGTLIFQQGTGQQGND